MDIRAIVLDMDGTLLTENKEILPKTKEKLIELQQKGIKVILASGRPEAGMLRYAKELQLDKYDGFIISSNGSHVSDIQTGEILFDKILEKNLVSEITNHVKKFDVKVIITDSTYGYTTDVYNGIIKYKDKDFDIVKHEIRANELLACEVRNFENLDFNVNKILLAGNPQYLNAVADEIYEPFKDRAHAIFTADFFFEFSAKNTGKAIALDSVIEKYNLTKDNIIAFGDGHNDKTLLQYASNSVAMGNAVDELKDLATYVTDTNENEGIYKALVKYFD